MNKVIIILFLSFSILACSKKSSPAPVAAPVQTNVIQMNGQVVSINASDANTEIKSPVIYDEKDQIVQDGKKFTIMGNDEIKVSNDNLTFGDSTIVTSLNGKISIFTKNVTNKAGSYRLKVIAEVTGAFSWYYINLVAGTPFRIESILGSQYHDDPPYNGRKDASEYWYVPGDGVSNSYFTVGIIYDKYDNIVENAKVELLTDRGSIVSENPVTSTEGSAVYAVQSTEEEALVNLTANVLDVSGTTIYATKSIAIKFSAPVLVLDKSADFGNVLLDTTKTVNYTLSNNGSGDAKNLTYNLDLPFFIDRDNSTCVVKTTLKAGESCTLSISYTAGVRAGSSSRLQILGSPTTLATASIKTNLTAVGVAPPSIEVSTINYDFNTKGCGTITDQEIFVKNVGDVNGANFRAIQSTNLGNQGIAPMQIILPTADNPPSSDLNAIVNCGTSLPPGRKCRVIVRYNPLQLTAPIEYYGSITVDGISPVGFIMRGESKPGLASGSLPITFYNPDISTPNQAVQSIPLSSNSRARVVIGPIQDLCGNNVVDGTIVDSTISKGIMNITKNTTNSGIAEFEWRGSDDVNDVGPQTINAKTQNNTVGLGILKFDGVKLAITGQSDVGQVLTKKPVAKIYTVTNNGTITANNLHLDLIYNNSLDSNGDGIPDRGSWGIIDNSYDGGCRNGILLAGTSCTIRVVINTLPFGVGHFEGVLTATSIERGLNHIEFGISGISQLPPVLAFDIPNYDFGSVQASILPHIKTVTLTNLGPAIAQDMHYVSSSPYSIKSNNCPINLSGDAGLNTCQIVLELDINQVGTYTGSLNITSELSSANLGLNGSIIPGSPSGIIPIVFDKLAVPADRNSIINITFGPIKDQFNNTVNLGVPVNILYDSGILNIDASNSGSVTIQTDSSGIIRATIRSKALDEVKQFSITAQVIESNAVIATGTKTGNFTGSIANFPDVGVDFGGGVIGVLKTKNIQLKNEGSETLSNLVFTSSNSDYTILDYGTCGGSPKQILAGQTCNLLVGFFPSTTGGSSGILTVIGTGNGVLSDRVNLLGNAILPAKLGIFLPVVEVSILPGANTSGFISLKNEGNETISSIVFSINNHPEYFSLDMTNCQSIVGLGTCSIPYIFNPSSLSAGDFIAKITFSGESPSRSVAVDQPFLAHPSTISISADVASLYVDECTNLTLKATSISGTTVNASGTIPIALTSTLNGSFYNGNNCTGTIVSSIPLISGQNTISGISFKPLASGNLIIQAGHPSIITGQYNLNVAPLFLKNVPSNISNLSNYGECEKFTITLETSLGVAYPSKSNFQMNLVSTNTGDFYGDSSCSTNKLTANYINFTTGSTTYTLYYKPLASGSNTISFTNPSRTSNPIYFMVYNLPILTINSSTSYECTKGINIVSCPNSVGIIGSNITLNGIEKNITSNVSTSSNVISLDSTNLLNVNDLIVIKTKPINEYDWLLINNYEYFRITQIVNSTSIKVVSIISLGNPTVNHSITNKVKLYVIPEFYNIYYKTGLSTKSLANNLSTGINGVTGFYVYNKIIGEKVSPINSPDALNSTIYGDGISLHIDGTNTTFIEGAYQVLTRACSSPPGNSIGGNELSVNGGITWTGCQNFTCNSAYTSTGNSCIVNASYCVAAGGVFEASVVTGGSCQFNSGVDSNTCASKGYSSAFQYYLPATGGGYNSGGCNTTVSYSCSLGAGFYGSSSASCAYGNYYQWGCSNGRWSYNTYYATSYATNVWCN